jgi:hypothetical protein
MMGVKGERRCATNGVAHNPAPMRDGQKVRDKPYLAMLRAFFDETGIDPELNPALVIAGFLGRVEDWEHVSDAWDECLKTPPSIEYFSHREAHSKEKMLDLAKVIARFPLRGFCVYIRHKSLAARDPKSMKSAVGSRPYDWAFLGAIDEVLEHVESLKSGEKVDFVFDHRNELKACIPAFYDIKEAGFKSCYRHAGQCDPGDDRCLLALQMADLLAGEFNSCKENGQLSDTLRVISQATHLTETECTPYPIVNANISLDRVSKQITRDAIAFLKKIRNVKEEKLSPGMAHELKELLQRDAHSRIQVNRYNDLLELDSNYQAFKKIFEGLRSKNLQDE